MRERTKALLIVSAATVIGFALRLWDLGQAPLWCDEAFYATDVFNWRVPQEFLPAAISHIFGVGTELAARMPFAIAGSLTIPAIYFMRPSKQSAWLSMVVATFPVFVLYSRMCRPYTMAGLFLVLAWHYRWMYWPMILTTPTAIVGLDLTAWRKNQYLYAGLIVSAVGLVAIRTDLDREGFLGAGMFFAAPRLWYIPLLAALLYLTYHIMPRYERLARGFTVGCVLVSAFSITQAGDILTFEKGLFKRWYSEPLFYNDWRGMPKVDLSMNFEQVTEYYTGSRAPILREYERHRIDSILGVKDTVLVGVDCYANHLSRWFIPGSFLDPYRQRLFDGEVMLVRLTKWTGEPQKGRGTGPVFIVEMVEKR